MSDTTPNQSAYCIFCGMQVAVKSNFCPFCGAARKIVESKIEVTPTPGMPNTCPNCNEEVDRAGAKFCHWCGLDLTSRNDARVENDAPAVESQSATAPASPQGGSSAGYTVIPGVTPVRPAASVPVPPKKADRVTAGILAILLGSIGVHKFYMGKIGHGILCILFCWTGIPALVGLIEGILYLTATDQEFQEKYM